jgi:uncharacterized protein YlxP (DUF503 family)
VYFAIAKILIDLDESTAGDQRLIQQLVERLRKKFKISAMTLNDSGGIPVGVGVAMLASKESDAHRKVDEIIRDCEEFGIGRVSWERALIDHIDAIDEE